MRGDSGSVARALLTGAVVALLAATATGQGRARVVGVGAKAPAKQARAALKVTGALPRSVVTVDGVRHGRVEQDGSRVIATLSPGRHTVVVRQPGLADTPQTVVLRAGATAVVRPKGAPVRDESELARQRGDDLALDGKHEEAVAEYARAVEGRGGRFAAAEIGLARSYLALKRTDEATDAINALLAREPKSVEAHTVLANIMRETGLGDDAIAEYRKAIALSPAPAPEAHTGLAITLGEHGGAEEAVVEFRKGIAQNGDAEPLLYQLLGGTLERLGRLKEAVAAYERYLELAPSSNLAPAVRSVLERLRQQIDSDKPEDGDTNPYAPH